MSREELVNYIVQEVAKLGGQASRRGVVQYVEKLLAGGRHTPPMVPPPRSADELLNELKEKTVILEVGQTPTLPGMDDGDAPAPFAITRISRGLAAAASTTPISEQLVMEYNREQEEAAQIVAGELLQVSGTQQFIMDGLLSILTEAQGREPDKVDNESVGDDRVIHRHYGSIKIIDHSGLPEVAIELPRAAFMRHAGAKTHKQRARVWGELCQGLGGHNEGKRRGHFVDYNTGRPRIKWVSDKCDHTWLRVIEGKTQYRASTRLKHLKGVSKSEVVDKIYLMIDRRYVATMMLFVEGGKMRGAGYINMQSQLRRELGRLLPPRETSNAYRLYLHLSLTQRTARPYSVREICQQFAPKYIKVSKAAGLVQLRGLLDAICKMHAGGQLAPITAYRIEGDALYVSRPAGRGAAVLDGAN